MKNEVEVREIAIPGQEVGGEGLRGGENTFIEGKKLFAQRLGIVNVDRGTVEIIPLKSKYIPKRGDVIFGVIKDASPMTWVVDILSPYTAYLPMSKVEFESKASRSAASRKLNIGDLILAKVEIFDYGLNPILTLAERGLGRRDEGRLIFVNPAKIPRIIGKRGSMIKLLKEKTGCEITIGKNGLILVSCPSEEVEGLIFSAIKIIERQSHTKGLTDRVKEFLERRTNREEG